MDRIPGLLDNGSDQTQAARLLKSKLAILQHNQM